MAKYQLLLPKMGESVAEATIIKWTKSPGDYIEVDEAVMEIATDKVDSEVPSPVAGKLIEQLYKEDDVVQVGSVIAIIETAPEETHQPESAPTPVAETVPEPVAYSPPAPEPDAVKPPEAIAPPASLPAQEVPEHDIPGMSQLEEKSVTAPTNTKFDNRFYSPLVKSIAVQEGISSEELDYIPGTGAEGRLTKDDLLGYLLHRASRPAFKPPVTAPEPQKQSEPQHQPEPLPITYADPAPVAQAEHQPVVAIPEPVSAPPVDSEAPVQAATPEPAAKKEDLKSEPAAKAPEAAPAQVAEPAKPAPAAETPTDAPTPAAPKAAPKPVTSVSGGDEIIEMDRMRRLIADHMVYSKHTSPHVTSFVEADVTELVAWREKMKGPFEKREGQKLTFTPIFIEAVVKAIIDMPMINVSVSGTQIIKKKNINISMATALPNGNLIVPVIKHADNLSLLGIAKSVNDLANRARIGKLLPDDVKDGTFTITNVGSFGNVMGTPIINQPQVAILAVGAIKKKPAVIETPQGDAIAIRHMMFLSLSYDHRVVDGALGGSFVRKVADYLENWDLSRSI